MAIFRCNKCGYLREVANEHIGKSAKCSQCQNVAGIHETTAFIEKIIEKYFTLQKELVNLREGTSSWDQLEIQVIDSPQSEPFSLKEIDPHNTKELTNNYQYLPIIEWFDKKNIKAKVNPRELDTTGFFDEIALALGNNYEKFKEIIINLEVCSHYTANLKVIVDSLRRNLMDAKRASQERRAIADSAIIEMVILSVMLLIVLLVVDTMVKASIWDILFHSLVGYIALGVAGICYLIFGLAIMKER